MRGDSRATTNAARSASLLDNLHPATHSLKCTKRTVQRGLIQCSGDLGTQSRFTFRHDGIPESLDINTFVQQGVAHILCHRRLSEHYRNDGMRSFKDFETESLDLLPEIGRIFM